MENSIKKLFNNPMFDEKLFINFCLPIVNFLSPVHESNSLKYDNKYFLVCIIDFLKTGCYWSRYRGTISYPINGKYLNQIHNKWQKKGVFKEINKQCLEKYLKEGKEKKLKYQMNLSE
jgi:hypothetical protein